MRNQSTTKASLLLLLASGVLPAAGLTVPDAAVGRNLQAAAMIRLAEVAPEGGVQLTLTSEDPARLVLSAHPDQPGSASITLTVKGRTILSPEYYLQALDDHGKVAYQVDAGALGSTKATVTLAKSAIVILGPFKLPSFPTTPRSPASRISLHSAMLDDQLKIVEEQPVSGKGDVEVGISSSEGVAGKLGAEKLVIKRGTSLAETQFQPSHVGRTKLVPVAPGGFSASAEYADVTALVEMPGLAISDQMTLGKDLQSVGVLCLGETPPAGGVQVTLVSSDPSKLLISGKEDETGKGTLTVTVKPGELTATYYLQAIGDSGFVTYRASAEGYRSRMARITLAPSGLIVAYEPYGPPDEATVLREEKFHEERRFFVSMKEAEKNAVKLAVYAAHLDPASGYVADITVQSLRAGVTAKVILKSSDPKVGVVETPLQIASGNNRVISKFTPLSPGETIISVDTPAGFSQPKNATKVPATVTQ